MTNTTLIEQRLREEVLKERMIIDSITILATVEYIQNLLEIKLLEIDHLQDNYRFEEVAPLKDQVLALLAKLRREEQRMDEFMVKYKRLIHEEKTLLPRPRKSKPIYLRGVPPNPRRKEEGQKVSGQPQT
jgi:hypothetical protein